MAQNNMSFIENKGQWFNNIYYKSELTFGNIYFEKDNFTFVLIENEEHNHNSEHFDAHSDEGIEGHHYKMKFIDANDVKFEEENQSLHYYNYFLGKDESKWASNVHAYKAIKYKNLYSGIDMKVMGEEDNMKYEYYIAPYADPQQIKVQYLGLDKLELKNGNLVYKTEIAGITETKPIVYQIVNEQKVYVKCNYKLDKRTNIVTYQFPEGYDESLELVIDPTLIFASYTGSTLNNFGYTATYDDDGNLFGGGIVYYRNSSFILDDNGIINGYPSLNSFNLVDSTNGGNSIASHGFASDMAISKFSSDGSTLLYSTLIGGIDNEQPQSLVTDTAGNLYIFGRTYSSDFPVTANAYDTSYNDINDTIPNNNNADIVVLKISQDGTTLLGSTYIGGLEDDGVNMSANPTNSFYYTELRYNYADDGRGEIIVNETGEVYVTSTTKSTDIFDNVTGFQNSLMSEALDTATSGFQDACIFKLNTDLSAMIWGSYLGGEGNDAGYSVKLDGLGNLFVAGGTNSIDFPNTTGGLNPNYGGGLADGFLAKIDTNGSILYQSTYLGTSSYDQSYFVEIDEFNNIYTYGQTTGAYPVSSNVYSNDSSSQFIHKLNNDIDTTMFSTVFGKAFSDSINISPTAFLVDNCLNIYISGWGGATNKSRNPLTGDTYNLPLTSDAFQATTDGSDFYFMVLSKDAGSLLYATYYGGNIAQEHVDGGTSRFDKKGTIYQAVCASCSGPNDNFPTTAGAWSQIDSSQIVLTNGSIINSGCNLGVIKMDIYIPPTIVQVDASPTATGCVPLNVNFESDLVNVNLITWDFGDGTTSHIEDPVHLYTDTGTYTIRLIGEDTSLCNLADTAYLTVHVDDDTLVADFIEDAIINCNNNSISLSSENYPSTQYLWTMGDGNTYTTDSVFHEYINPGVYTIDLMITDSTSCELMDSATTSIEILPSIDASINLTDTFGCIELFVQYNNIINIAVDSLYWNFGDGFQSSLLNPAHTYTSVGTFQVEFIASDSNTCNLSDTAYATVTTIDDRIAADIQIDTLFYECDSLIMRFSSLNGNASTHDWDFGNGIVSSDSTVDVAFTDGNYTGSYIVTDTNMICKPMDTVDFSFVILPEIKANISLSDSFGCIPLEINFTNLTNIAVTDYLWNFGDLNSSTQENPTHTYSNVGTYQVEFIASDSNTCNFSDTAFATVTTVDDRVAADIQIDTLFYECDSLIMRFSSLNGNASTHDWDFGNGIVSSDSTVDVAFTDGNYTGSYIVTDTNMICKPMDTIDFSFVILPEIKANISLSDSFGCIPLEINFTNLTNIAVTDYLWNFGDLNSSTQENPTHTYSNVGTYQVEFIASDSNTCNFSDTAFATVTTVDDRVAADIQIDTLFYECDSLIMRFSSLNGNASTHDWDFGNGIVSSDSTVDVTFTDGNYTGSYIVTDTNMICKPMDTVDFSFVILPEFQLVSSISDSSGCLPLTIIFNASLDYPVDSISWHFGDGNASNILNPTYTYTTAGNFLATFIAIDSGTCNVSESAQYPIIVNNDIAIASISVNETPFVCDSLVVNFESNSLIGSHFWDFGDGNTSNSNPVNHTYSNYGIYDVVYILYDATKACNPYDTAFYQVKFDQLIASIDISDTVGCIPFNYAYATSTMAPYYLWDFGDNTGSVTLNGNHLYLTENIYNVSFLAIDSTTCNIFDTAFATVITEDTRVIADFDYTILNDCDELLSVQIDNQSINAVDYTWIVDQNLYSNLEEPGIIDFTSVGMHEIMLIVENDTLCNTLDTLIISLELKPNAWASFTVDDNCENSTVQILNTSLNSDSYFWSFGNGESSLEVSPIVVYNQSGVFTISLTITDSSSCNINHIISETVTILDYAEANFETDSINYIYPDDVQFTNLSSNYDNFLWSFGDGETDDLEIDPIHSYDILYEIKPCLSVWNEYCGDTICKNIYIDFLELVGVPNAFSPNADGINDVLYVEGVGIRSLNFKIYNRWGEIVFQSDDQSLGWDGKYKNIDQEMEVYTYVLEVIFLNDKDAELKGNITLLR